MILLVKGNLSVIYINTARSKCFLPTELRIDLSGAFWYWPTIRLQMASFNHFLLILFEHFFPQTVFQDLTNFALWPNFNLTTRDRFFSMTFIGFVPGYLLQHPCSLNVNHYTAVLLLIPLLQRRELCVWGGARGKRWLKQSSWLHSRDKIWSMALLACRSYLFTSMGRTFNNAWGRTYI